MQKGVKIVSRYPKTTEEFSVKAIRVPKRILDRMDKLAQAQTTFAKIEFTAFANEAIQEKLERLEKRNSK